MLPLSDGIPARRFPIVNVFLIVANFAVRIFYELPQLNTAVYHASFYPCTVDNACLRPEAWGLSWTWIFPTFLVRIRAWIFLGLWFLYQLIEASFELFSASANGGGVAFFAHVGGFIFGLLIARLLARAGQAAPGEQRRSMA